MLKREPAARWLSENCDSTRTSVYLGIDWTEAHRFEHVRARRMQEGWSYFAPLCEAPYLSKNEVFEWLKSEGIRSPRLYRLGFAHNNCGGFCVKAGQGHFAHLLHRLPARYLEHEAEEQKHRRMLKKDVAILADRQGGEPRRPLTLKAFRKRLHSRGEYDANEIGGCGCFSGEESQ
jgi:hypothetical protein